MSIKDFFIKSEAAPPVRNPKAAGMPTIPPNGSIVGAPIMLPTAQVDASTANEFSQYLMKLMDDANLPGPDYYEFAKALHALDSVPLTEQQKYISVFAALQAQGVAAQSLVDAAGKYIAILGQMKSKEFDASVMSAEQQVKNREESIRIWTEENTKLQQQLMDNAKRIGDTTTEVAQMKQKLEVKKTTFNMSYQSFINKIMADIENIKKYLINGNTTQ